MNKNLSEKEMADYAKSMESDDSKKVATPESVAKRKTAIQELEEAQNEKREDLEKMKMSNGLGYIKIPLDTLPTKGKFYPEGTVIWIRSATGEEIRHWSLTNETDLPDIDDALNYMLERCATIRIPGKLAGYRDLKEIDRFFVILSIRDFTFPDGNNELMIKLDENTQVPLKKDGIDFIHLDESIMKYYNPTGRCFTVCSYKIRGHADGKPSEIKLQKPLNIYMPSTGITMFIKDYLKRKMEAHENFNKDFIGLAPLLIPDYRGLNDNSYASFIADCDYFDKGEYSILAWFKRKVADSIEPKFVYLDKEGMEQTTPLNFQGGIKSLFLYTVDDII